VAYNLLGGAAMTLTLEVPDDLAARLEASWRDLSSETLEALAVEAYVRGDLSSEEVQRLLHLTSRETDALLGLARVNEIAEPEVAAAAGTDKRELSPIQRRALARMKKGFDFGGAPYPQPGRSL
jgi:hypothetical protein